MKKEYENPIIHYRHLGRVSAEHRWDYWIPVCGKKAHQVLMLTCIKEKVTCKACKKTADYY